MISLWQCRHAQYPTDDIGYITCTKGHFLGLIAARMAKKGKPLICWACQGCQDCDIMGEDLKKEERGWIKK